MSIQPALIHLAISAAIALAAIAVIYRVWYPGALAQAQGVSNLVLIMIGVDVVLGPLVTLIIFKPGKKGLRFDLAVIAVVQAAALLYGLQAIHGGRPAYVVFNVDRFDLVPIQDIDADSLSRVPDDLAVSQFGPRWVAARLPDDVEARNTIMFSAIQGGADLAQLPEYYLPLDSAIDDITRALHPVQELRKLNELTDAEWAAFIGAYHAEESALGYLPMRANDRDGAVILNRSTGEILDAVMLTPSFERSKEAVPGSPE